MMDTCVKECYHISVKSHALVTYYHVHSCFSKWEVTLCFPLSKSCNPADQLSQYQVPSKKIFTDQKYPLSLKSYGNFHNPVYLASTIKQSIENEETTGEDYFYLVYFSKVYNIRSELLVSCTAVWYSSI